MAHYDITHTCGHDERIELFGKTSERERRIEWLQERPCTECWKKERAAEAEARRNKEAAMIVEKLGNDAADAVNALSNATCTLEGSAKQVAWAEDIRAKCIRPGHRPVTRPCGMHPRQGHRPAVGRFRRPLQGYRLHDHQQVVGGMVDREP